MKFEILPETDYDHNEPFYYCRVWVLNNDGSRSMTTGQPTGTHDTAYQARREAESLCRKFATYGNWMGTLPPKRGDVFEVP